MNVQNKQALNLFAIGDHSCGRVYCSRCRRNTLCSKKLKLMNQLPPVLMFWSNIDAADYNEIGMDEKQELKEESNGSCDLFPKEIDFSESRWKMVIDTVPNNPNYELCALLQQNKENGRYSLYFISDEYNEWFECNKNGILEINLGPNILQAKNAVLLLYRQKTMLDSITSDITQFAAEKDIFNYGNENYSNLGTNISSIYVQQEQPMQYRNNLNFGITNPITHTYGNIASNTILNGNEPKLNVNAKSFDPKDFKSMQRK